MEIETTRLIKDFASKLEAFVNMKAARLATDAILKACGPNGRTAPKANADGRRPPTATRKLRTARVIQGQYLGRLKKLTGGARNRVKAMAKSHSVGEAVKLADKILARGAKN